MGQIALARRRCRGYRREVGSPLETVKAAWEDFERRGYDGMLDAFADDAEWVQREGVVLRGKSEIAAWTDELVRSGVKLEPRSYTFEQHGPHVVVAGGLRTVSNGGMADAHRAWVYTVENGKLRRVVSCCSRDEALRKIAS